MDRRRISRRSFVGFTAAALTPRATAAARAQPAVVTAHDSRFDPWVELRVAHLLQNAEEVARVTGRPIMAVIKNNAYGCGLANAAQALTKSKAVRALAVVKLHEALSLRNAGVTAPLLMMGPFDATDAAEMHARDIMPMVYTPIGDVLARAAKGSSRPLTVHVKIDTGLGRVGVPYRDASRLIRELTAAGGVEIGGIMTTLTEDAAFDQEQLRRFEQVASELGQQNVKVGLRHAASSYTLFQHQHATFDMIRPGMVLYGIYPEPKFRAMNRLALQPALAFRTRVLYVKRLAAGESAGYERAFVAKSDTWVATLPVGHADGWPRAAAKGAKARIGERLYPVIASVSASHTILDIGRDPTVQVGDVATLFDWEEGSRPEDVAAACGASVYDLTMHLGAHLARRVV
jgi:alanine racemase